MSADDPARLVRWFRQSSPYINAHRGATMVIGFGGEALTDGRLPALIHDLALLNSLGVRLVLVPGARPQIEQRLRARGVEIRYVNGLRVTDEVALGCVKEAVGIVRVELEAQLSMGLANSPMAGQRLRVVSGNAVTARPLGVRDGVDYLHTGEVRRVDAAGLRQSLDDGAVVLVSPLGYSPTGEAFNLYAEDVANAVARALGADKLILLREASVTGPTGALPREMTTDEARGYLAKDADAGDELRRVLGSAIDACHGGVRRVHLLDRRTDGALLMELFTRDGVGTLVTPERFERTRQASVEDVGGVLELIQPLEREGILVRRSREHVETEMARFTVIEREGTIVACAALHPLPQSGMAEIACLAVHGDYRGGGRGDQLLRRLEAEALAAGITRLFVLTTRTAHWFRERGFERGSLSDLPVERRELYNLKRSSQVYLKTIAPAQ